MKTLLACGTCFEERAYGQAAFWRWFFYYRQFADKMGVTHFLCCNDGWKNVPLENSVDLRHSITLEKEPVTKPLTVFYQSERLGRLGCHWFPGWWRNVALAARATATGGFDKMYWIEWDAFVISDRMMAEMRGTQNGIVAYYCPSHGFPESSLFICGRDKAAQLSVVAEQYVTRCLAKESLTTLREPELAIPWTEIRQHQIGDRYGEFGPYPENADFVCQWIHTCDYPRMK